MTWQDWALLIGVIFGAVEEVFLILIWRDDPIRVTALPFQH